jgi:ParB family chromosome partitioning protein
MSKNLENEKHLQLKNQLTVKGINQQLDEKDSSSPMMISTNRITLPGSQPRRYFDPDKHKQLVLSVKRAGILQPLLVRSKGDDFELVAGERRYRAAQEAGLNEVPVFVRSMTDQQARECALTENLQREDLNPVDETEGILGLLELRLAISQKEVIALLNRMAMEKRGSSGNVVRYEEKAAIEEVFASIGRLTPESFRTHRLPLLNLPQDLLEALRAGKIEYTKVKAIAQVKDESERQQLLSDVIEQGLPLTQIKEQVKALKGNQPTKEPPGTEDLRKRVNSLAKIFKTSTKIDEPQVRHKLEKLLVQVENLI